jgi:asparagine synthase (glutamine-hydrolysing)
LARDNGTIVLQVGEGSDELFGGYSHWMTTLRLRRGWWQAYGALPSPVRRAALALAAPIRDDLRYEYMRRGTAGEEMFWGGAIAFGEARKRRLLAAEAQRRTAGLNSHEVIQPYRRRFDERSPLRDYLSWMSYLDLRFRLPELLLMRVDKMSMATSVEARVPFLDHEFVGLAMSIPQKTKLDGGHPPRGGASSSSSNRRGEQRNGGPRRIFDELEAKHLLKRAVRGLLPDEIIDRPKQGFRVPVHEWLSESLGSFTRDKLRGFCARTDYLRWDTVEHMLARNDYLTWYLLNFAMWHEKWIEGIEA